MNAYTGEDFAGVVESLICQNDGTFGLGRELARDMRKTLEMERPLTKEDAENWTYSIGLHCHHNRKRLLALFPDFYFDQVFSNQ